MRDAKTYTINPCLGMLESFIGSILIEFESNQNLQVPFCAVIMGIKAKSSVCAVHTYGRRLEEEEIGGMIDLSSTKEIGWTLRDSESIQSFAVFHNGKYKSELKFTIEVQNHFGDTRKIEFNKKSKPFETIIIIPQDLFINHVRFLDG
jgi:hypothetical protein